MIPRDETFNGTFPFKPHFSGEAEAIGSKPAMLAEGLRDRTIPPHIALTHFRAGFPKGAVVELENAGHFCQEDEPATLIVLIEQFIQLTK
jgi:pimeloyl-ACP methyl ester carboxylesterase